ncbi:MAG TPA: hypothetical protein VKB50_09115 [Vicinamibacterales bacterium]|nr:hypothetical protein [Vicinamibacterales bacterium]
MGRSLAQPELAGQLKLILIGAGSLTIVGASPLARVGATCSVDTTGRT